MTNPTVQRLKVNGKDTYTYNNDYIENYPIWETIRDCIAGDKKIKEGGTKYLPMPCPNDKSEANKKRYRDYKDRAYFMNATSRTKDALLGAAFYKKPTYQLTPNMEYLAEDSDGNGKGLVSKAREVTGDVIALGRFGILVDFPQIDGDEPRTVLSQENGARPFLSSYVAENIVDWRVEKFGAVSKLAAVKLVEKSERLDNFGFATGEFIDVERILYIDKEDGYYKQKVTEMDSDDNVGEEIIVPLDGNGQPLTFIPFVFFGSHDNDEVIDKAPLYDLSVINIAHYRNSADYEHSLHLVGQPTLVVTTAMDEEELDSKEIVWGSNSAIVLGVEDNARLEQPEPNSMPKEGMAAKEEQMRAIGARLISPSKQQTAEAARIEQGTDMSVLSTIVDNVTIGMTQCLDYCEIFLTGEVSGDNVFIMSNEFFFTKMTAQERQVWMADIMAGNLPREDYWEALRESKIISDSRSNDDIESDIQAQGPEINLDEE